MGKEVFVLVGQSMQAAMNWPTLLSPRRLRESRSPRADGRSPFQQDLDRIVFSFAFRRLQNKTQVHSLPGNDHVRNRLTHSVEVASVGRSLGALVGRRLGAKHPELNLDGEAIGHIVHAAALAHDIGNPPFGHSGEDAIRQWFRERLPERLQQALSPAQRADFEAFEGNAQGFRILTQLENHRWEGGLRLTHATLAAFMKYPRASDLEPRAGDPGGKKVGFYQAERAYMHELAKELGLPPRQVPGEQLAIGENLSAPRYWARHPLAYLVEAADDICYTLVDLEDGFELRMLSYEQVREAFAPFLGNYHPRVYANRREEVGHWRASAIGCLIAAAAEAFCEHEAELLEGNFMRELLSATPHWQTICQAQSLAEREIFSSPRKARAELSGHEVIVGLLDDFGHMIHALMLCDWRVEKLRGREAKLSELLGVDLLGVGQAYPALLRITDFIAGMTDRYALELFRALRGYGF